jgi:hypothetical protein
MIPESEINFMKNFLILLSLFFIFACQSESQKSSDQFFKIVSLTTPYGDTIETKLAITPSEQEQGLSGVRPENFYDHQGLLFFYLEDDLRHFWMPDTYFDLDLIYVDKDFKITDIIRKLPFYKGRANPDLIPRARGIWARHVLEMKSGSKISEKLKIGDSFIWKGKLTLSETENKIRQGIKSN